MSRYVIPTFLDKNIPSVSYSGLDYILLIVNIGEYNKQEYAQLQVVYENLTCFGTVLLITIVNTMLVDQITSLPRVHTITTPT